MVLKRRGLPFLILFLTSLFLFPVLDAGLASAEGVSFSKGRIHDRNAEEDTVFIFTVTITLDREPDAPAELVVESTAYPMLEVDHEDTNFSDGKDFYYESKFQSGPKFFFFRCGNQSTSASTFNVEGFSFLEQYHPDLVIGMILFIAPVIYFLVLLNRMKRTTIALSGELTSLSGVKLGDGKKSEVSLKQSETGEMKERSKNVGKGGMILLILLVLGILLSTHFGDDTVRRLSDPDDGTRAGEENDEVVVMFSREAIQPAWGHGGDTFLFTVTITSPEAPAEPVEMNINDEPNIMKEINPDDTNFSNGKEFFHREAVDQGGWVVFFKSGNFTSTTKTLSVAETRQAQYHYDVAGVLILFIVPVIIGVWIFKQMEKEMDAICRALTALSRSMVERDQRK